MKIMQKDKEYWMERCGLAEYVITMSIFERDKKILELESYSKWQEYAFPKSKRWEIKIDKSKKYNAIINYDKADYIMNDLIPIGTKVVVEALWEEESCKYWYFEVSSIHLMPNPKYDLHWYREDELIFETESHDDHSSEDVPK